MERVGEREGRSGREVLGGIGRLRESEREREGVGERYWEV